jgi:cob(I)alamin adenosyltransferase
VKIYTKTGDDGTTGLFYGDRVTKDSERPRAYGAVDEAQALLGLARSGCEHGSELDGLLVGLARDLYVVMAELATGVANQSKLKDGVTRPVAEMVEALETLIDDYSERFDPPTDFVIPGGDPVAAALDVARTVVRRAERESLSVVAEGSVVVPYLNRLSDLLWTLARWQEGSSEGTKAAAGTLQRRPPRAPGSGQ